MIRIGLLVKVGEGAPPPPEASAHGRAALRLLGEGIEVVFGQRGEAGTLSGFAARPSHWVPVERAAIAAAYDRFPFGRFPEQHRALTAALAPAPIANPPALAALCRDKVAVQRELEADGVDMPEIETDPARFNERLRGWGAAFLKPQLGSFGRGVVHVEAGAPIPTIPPDRDGPRFLQRAVEPPAGLGGACVRILVQRDPGGAWLAAAPVAIVSQKSRVASAERGAECLPAGAVFAPALVESAIAASLRVGELLSRQGGERLLELGIDLAPGPDQRARVLEVNAQPRGRLERLAAREPARYGDAHLESACRPLRYLAKRFGR